MYIIRFDKGQEERFQTAEEARETYFRILKNYERGVYHVDEIPYMIHGNTKSRIVDQQKFVEFEYVGYEWSDWKFEVSKERKAHFIYMPEYGLWRRNVSTDTDDRPEKERMEDYYKGKYLTARKDALEKKAIDTTGTYTTEMLHALRDMAKHDVWPDWRFGDEECNVWSMFR